MRPGGRYPSPGLIVTCCLVLIAVWCALGCGYIVLVLAF